jgi:serine/threonine-protein kinase HipA
LLAAIGTDLPGAIVFEKDDLELPQETQTPPSYGARQGSAKDSSSLRFSLAGVQLKFSMLMVDRKLTLPAENEDGDWIVKLSFDDFPALPENEHAVMTWARSMGYEVPETRAVQLARATVARARETWDSVRDLMPPDHRAELAGHWKRVPLLSESGGIG